jgi:OOP family OmpA-OmpF porin
MLRTTTATLISIQSKNYSNSMATSIKKALCFSGILVGMGTGVFAQNAYIKAADEHYTKGDYYGAAQLYEKGLSGKTDKKEEYHPYTNNKTTAAPASISGKSDATFRLAESYYQLHQFEKAEPLFKAAADAGNADAGYYYAKCLKFNGKAAEAQTALQAYSTQANANPALLADAKQELASTEFAKTQMLRKDLGRYQVTKAGMNTQGATYAPASMNGQLVFTSTRPDADYLKSNPNTNKLYRQPEGSPAELIGLAADAGMEQGVASFYGNNMYYTKWQLVNGKKQASIYKAEKSGTGWTAIQALGTAVNASGASASQPYVTSDGKWLLFSSDMAGGMGKKDIWAIGLDAAGNPTGTASNLKSINSAGDDEAPFYHLASKTLVFASNGRVGMGGYDLYSAKGDITGTMKEPVNMGYPVNSIKDDIYYLSTDAKSVWNNAYLSSDRASECCLELFAFNKLKVKKQVTGKVVDCQGAVPVIGATITAKDVNGKEVYSGKTDASGQYSFMMDDYTPLQTTASAEGYVDGSLSVMTPTDEEVETFNAAPLCMNKEKPKPVEVNQAIVLENVLYDFGKSTLRKESYPKFDKLIEWMKEYPNMAIELSAHTDNIGSDAFNQKLSEKRAASCVDYLVSKGIAKDRIIAKGYGETQPVAPNQVNGKDNPEGRKLNRRTEFKVLHY